MTGGEIIARRKELRLSRAELAMRMGVTASTVGNWEKRVEEGVKGPWEGLLREALEMAEGAATPHGKGYVRERLAKERTKDVAAPATAVHVGDRVRQVEGKPLVGRVGAVSDGVALVRVERGPAVWVGVEFLEKVEEMG